MLLLGILSSFAFAPDFLILPALFSFAIFLSHSILGHEDYNNLYTNSHHGLYKNSRQGSHENLYENVQKNSHKHSFNFKFFIKKIFLFSFGFHLGNFYWICAPLTVDFSKYRWLIPVAVVVLPVYIACFTSFFLYIYKRLYAKIDKHQYFLSSFFLAFCLLLSEYSYSYLFSGFPWSLIAYIWNFSNITTQITSIVGSFGLSFITYFFISMLAHVFYNCFMNISFNNNLLNLQKIQNYNFGSFMNVEKIQNLYKTAFFMLLGVFLFGVIRLYNAKTEFHDCKLRLVQSNHTQKERLDEQMHDKLFNDLLKISVQNLSPDIGMVIWPEVSIQSILTDDNNKIINRILPIISKTILASGIVSLQFDRYYNSIAFFKTIGNYEKSAKDCDVQKCDVQKYDKNSDNNSEKKSEKNNESLGSILNVPINDMNLNLQTVISQSKIDKTIDKIIEKDIKSTMQKRNAKFYSDVLLYNKSHLVPYGEYVPMRSALSSFNSIANEIGDFDRGDEKKLCFIDCKIPKFISTICYESIFSDEIRKEVEAAEWILNITNDSWFMNMPVLYHFSKVCMVRAIETGLPFVRVSNGGVSYVFDGYGRTLCKCNIGKMEKRDFLLPKKVELTLFAKYGHFCLQFLLYFVLMLLLLMRRRRLV